MHISTKLLSSIVLAVALSACGSVQHKHQLSENLIFAPAIDIPYSEVNKDINANIGLHVRWGGQIISSEKVGNITELTVFGSPLSKDGRPIPSSKNDLNGGRFVIKVNGDTEISGSRFVTVYGQVTGSKQLVNGPKTIAIPVVAAIDTKEWRRDVTDDRRGNAYYSLGFSTGHFNLYNGYGHLGYGRYARSPYYYSYHSNFRFNKRNRH